jgi:hypothetical protein
MIMTRLEDDKLVMSFRTEGVRNSNFNTPSTTPFANRN